ncbi:MAG: hypothetical protein QNJ54_23835 [Prochloraceae cyanobacterium]|nr:hypothetical protein [Prochloraceae cyanobacterium]
MAEFKITFSEFDKERIAKLPDWIQDLKDKYPNTIINTARDWCTPPIPSGFIPERISFFYGDIPKGCDLVIYRGVIDSFCPSEPEDSEVIMVRICGDERPEPFKQHWEGWAYIQAGGHVLLDKIGMELDGRGILPRVMLDSEVFLRNLLKIRANNDIERWTADF